METNSGYSSDKAATEVDYSYFNNVLFSQKKSNDLISTKTKLLIKITELEMSIRSCSKLETITAVMKLVRAAINFAKLWNVKLRKGIKRKISPNQNFEKQLKFFSTKKKWMNLSPVLTKPSFDQSEKCKEALSKTNSLFCGSCFKENDMNYENQGSMDPVLQFLYVVTSFMHSTNINYYIFCHFCV